MDEIKALINDRFDQFSGKLASIGEKFDKIRVRMRFIWNWIKLKKIQKNLELKLVKTDEIDAGLKFQIGDQEEQIIKSRTRK